VFVLACCAARPRPAALIARLLVTSARASATGAAEADDALRAAVTEWQARCFLAPAATFLRDVTPTSSTAP
jgi:hypothetical protein